jgi:UDP-N-acetylmuramyl tripeptide synthase
LNDWLDSRRLIGPNIVWDRPGALLEVAGEGASFDARIDQWRQHCRKLLDGLGWTGEDLKTRQFPGGALLIISAPVNALYTATEVNEDGWTLAGEDDGDIKAAVTRLKALRDEEADPVALAIHQQAMEQGKTCLVDEHGVSVGMGIRGKHWPADQLPDPANIDWSDFDDIPTVLVTGTNGKTTTVRLLAAMARAAGVTAGLSSTDWIQVGDEVLELGDYSGPGGAREVLRDSRSELAILETARGGLLRRGLALQRARAAVVTNIAEDHLGDGGIDDLKDLAEVKFMVTGVLGREGIAVLNAEDRFCRQHGEQLPGPVAWFGLAPMATGERSEDRYYYLEGGLLRRRIGDQTEDILPVIDAPITLGGSAHHNVANALAACAAAEALDLPMAAIREALQHFGSHIDDNPGRANYLEIGGVQILLDFAHNPDGMKAIFAAGKAMGANRTAVMFGQAGDRTDEAIVDLSAAVVDAGVDFVVIKEMGEYRRGREPGEIPAIIRRELVARGLSEDEQLAYAETEPEAAALAFRWARPGDLLMLFVHSERDAVIDRLLQEAGCDS